MSASGHSAGPKKKKKKKSKKKKVSKPTEEERLEQQLQEETQKIETNSLEYSPDKKESTPPKREEDAAFEIRVASTI